MSRTSSGYTHQAYIPTYRESSKHCALLFFTAQSPVASHTFFCLPFFSSSNVITTLLTNVILERECRRNVTSDYLKQHHHTCFSFFMTRPPFLSSQVLASYFCFVINKLPPCTFHPLSRPCSSRMRKHSTRSHCWATHRCGYLYLLLAPLARIWKNIEHNCAL